MKFHPDILAAHAEFGGDLEDMQRRYDAAAPSGEAQGDVAAEPVAEAKEWLIRKNGYFYRPNCQGYTTRKVEAGRYTKAKAESEASIEPRHMKAIHESEWPDEPTVASLNEQIASLSERLAEVERERDEHLRLKNALVLAAYPAMDAVDAIRKWCDEQPYENDTITVARLREMLPKESSAEEPAP